MEKIIDEFKEIVGEQHFSSFIFLSIVWGPWTVKGVDFYCNRGDKFLNS
jgi:hypothetical protein